MSLNEEEPSNSVDDFLKVIQKLKGKVVVLNEILEVVDDSAQTKTRTIPLHKYQKCKASPGKIITITTIMQIFLHVKRRLHGLYWSRFQLAVLKNVQYRKLFEKKNAIFETERFFYQANGHIAVAKLTDKINFSL